MIGVKFVRGTRNRIVGYLLTVIASSPSLEPCSNDSKTPSLTFHSEQIGTWAMFRQQSQKYHGPPQPFV